jgi:hypothetical protein
LQTTSAHAPDFDGAPSSSSRFSKRTAIVERDRSAPRTAPRRPPTPCLGTPRRPAGRSSAPPSAPSRPSAQVAATTAVPPPPRPPPSSAAAPSDPIQGRRNARAPATTSRSAGGAAEKKTGTSWDRSRKVKRNVHGERTARPAARRAGRTLFDVAGAVSRRSWWLSHKEQEVKRGPCGSDASDSPPAGE